MDDNLNRAILGEILRGRFVRELAIAGVWLFFAASLFYIEPEMQGDAAIYVGRGKWIALAFAGINALRPLVKWGGLSLLRRMGLIPTPQENFDDDLPPRPRIVNEPDDRIQSPPPPPGSFKP